jgi:hypothetical protein
MASIKILRPATVVLVALTLSSCATRNEVPASAELGDDDVFCRANNVAVGSSEYVACRKDRDVQRSNAVTRANRAQRNLGDYMLNNPGRP